jgi:hypothetical protein
MIPKIGNSLLDTCDMLQLKLRYTENIRYNYLQTMWLNYAQNINETYVASSRYLMMYIQIFQSPIKNFKSTTFTVRDIQSVFKR